MVAIDLLNEFKMECELRKLSKRTIKGYYNNVALFLNYIQKENQLTELDQITHLHIKGYMRYLISKKLSESYANGILKCLRAYYVYCVQEDYVKENVCKRVQWQREGKVLINAFSDDEVKELLKAFDYSTYLQARNKTILAVAFDTGARNTEICDILNIDISEESILIHGKGNKQRRVALSPYVKKCMAKYIRLRDYQFMNKTLKYDNFFLSRTGRPLTKEALEFIFNQANEKAQIRDTIRCSPHTARHYFAQAQLKNGLDVYSLSRLLGHENINITKRYLQSIQDEKIVEMSVKTSPLMNLL